MDSCYFCTETERLERHHIVPRRYDGSDNDENLVEVCPNCHSKLEYLYGKRFYTRLGVGDPQERKEILTEAVTELGELLYDYRVNGNQSTWDIYETLLEDMMSNFRIKDNVCDGCGMISSYDKSNIEPPTCQYCGTPKKGGSDE